MSTYSSHKRLKMRFILKSLHFMLKILIIPVMKAQSWYFEG